MDGEQGTEFIGAAFRHGNVEIAGGDQFGDVGSDRDRPGDPAGQSPGDKRGQQQRQRDANDVKLQIVPDRRPGTLPVQEAVTGGVIHEQVDLVIDPLPQTDRGLSN